jgi:hypothetical protein
MKNLTDVDVYKRIQNEAMRMIQAGKDNFVFITGLQNPQMSVPGTCEIRDPKTGSVFSIKYTRGLSTIFTDLMSDREKVMRPEQIIFQRGSRMVNANDTNLLIYLLICSYNENSIYRFDQHAVLFKQFDIDQKSQEYNSKVEKVIEAQSAIRSMSPNEVMAISFAMSNGLEPVSSLVKHPISELRQALYAKATNSPELIMNAISNPVMKVKYWMSRAIMDGHIVEDRGANKLSFKNGLLIAQSHNMPVFDYFCEMCDKKPEFMQSLKDIIMLVEPTLKADEEFDVKRGVAKDFSLISKIINESKELQVIEETPEGVFVRYHGSKRAKKYGSISELEEELMVDTSRLTSLLLANKEVNDAPAE